jgi:hypothetical protein
MSKQAKHLYSCRCGASLFECEGSNNESLTLEVNVQGELIATVFDNTSTESEDVAKCVSITFLGDDEGREKVLELIAALKQWVQLSFVLKPLPLPDTTERLTDETLSNSPWPFAVNDAEHVAEQIAAGCANEGNCFCRGYKTPAK